MTRTGFKRTLANMPRILYSAIGRFIKDDCYNQAATLTFYTVQSIVPLFAALLGIAKGFGLDTDLRTVIIDIFADQKEVLGYVLEMADATLSHLKSGVVTGVGAALLFWTSINLIAYIETALNKIWGVKAPKSFYQRSKDFLAILIVAPLALIISSSLTIFFKTQVNAYLSGTLTQPLATAINFVLPFILSSFLFFFLFILIPKTRTNLWSRVFAAALAGVLYQLWQLVYVWCQAGIFNYNAVYGALSIIPLFLIWLQVAWLIVLFCAEIAAHLES